MDPLTHALAGAAVADVLGAPERLGRAALPFAMILAAAPDLDVLPAVVAAFPSNPFTGALLDPRMMQLYHRGYTHALPILLAAAIAFGLAGWRMSGQTGRRRHWVALAVAALVSHSLLDIANGYVRFWLPFSTAWVGWGYAPEGDPVLILVLGAVLMANHPFRFVNKHTLGTLDILEKTSGALHHAIHPRIGARALSLIGLAAIPLRALARYYL